MRDTGLGNTTGNGVLHQFFMPFATGATFIDLRHGLAVFVITICINDGHGPCTARRCPRASRGPVGNGNPLAALDQRQDIHPSHAQRVDRLHDRPIVPATAHKQYGRACPPEKGGPLRPGFIDTEKTS